MDTPPEPNPTLASQDERVMAALSHVSVLIPGMGVIAPILIWVTQREKSKYVAFQSLQALIYQLVFPILGFAGGFCYVGSIFLMGFLAVAISNMNFSGPELVFFFPFLILGLIALIGFAMVIYGLAGAVMAFQGKDFHYLVLGDFLRRNMEK